MSIIRGRDEGFDDEGPRYDDIEPPRRVEMTPTERLLLGAVALVLLGLMVQFAWLSTLSSRMADQNERHTVADESTAENRAVSCRVLLTLGQQLSPDGPCYEPEVLRFYSPAETITGGGTIRTNLDALCDIADYLEVSPPPDACQG